MTFIYFTPVEIKVLKSLYGETYLQSLIGQLAEIQIASNWIQIDGNNFEQVLEFHVG